MNPTWLYVAALYALAVWLARRCGVELRWRIAFFFYALVLIFLWRPMTQAYVNVPVDFLGSLPPWVHVQPAKPANGEINDVVLQMVPWANEVREHWKSLSLPLWNPHAASGYPLLANGQSAALSPLRILALPLSLGESFTAEAAMKLLIAMTFMFLFCRRRGYSEIAGAVGAVAWGFCTFMIVWLHFPHATVAAYLPAVLLQIDLLAERVTFRRFVFAVVVWVVAIFGGHPETVSHIFFLALLTTIWLLVIERRFAPREAVRFVLRLGAVMAVAALIAAPFLAAFAEAVTKSQRYQQLQVHPQYVGFTDFRSSILLLQPHFFGAVPREKAWGPAVAESLGGFAGVLGVAGWFALLIEAAATRRWRTREFLFVLATPLLLGVILDWSIIAAPFNLLFGLAANARVRLLLCFVVAVQAAAAIDLAERGRRRSVLLGLAVVSAMLFVLFVTTAFPTASAREATILTMLPSFIVLAIAAWFVSSRRFRPVVGSLVLFAVILELWSVGGDWNPVVPMERMYPPTPLLRRLDALRAAQPPNAPFRVVGVGPMLFPNLSSIFHFQDIRAHDPMANGRYVGLLRVVTGYESESYFAHWKNVETRLLDFLNVKYVITDPHIELKDRQRYRLIYNAKDGRIYENRDALPRFFPVRNVVLEFKGEQFIRRLITQVDWTMTGIVKTLPVENDQERLDLLAPRSIASPEASVRMVAASDTDFRMHVHAPRYALVVSSQPYWPGWRVERDGRSVDPLPVNGAFLGFTVPPGDWDVRVHYVPLTFYCGLAASLITIGVLIALSFRQRRGPRGSPARSE
jgi:membrane protein YfhO